MPMKVAAKSKGRQLSRINPMHARLIKRKARRKGMLLAHRARRQAKLAQRDIMKAGRSKSPVTRIKYKTMSAGHAMRAMSDMVRMMGYSGSKGAKADMSLSRKPKMSSLGHLRKFNKAEGLGHQKGLKGKFIRHVKAHKHLYNIPTVKHREKNGKIMKTHFYAQAFMKSKGQLHNEHRLHFDKHEDKMHMKGMPTHHDLKKHHGVYMNKKHHTVIGVGPAIVNGKNKILHSHHKEHHHSKSYRMKAPSASINHSYEQQHSAQQQNAVNGPSAQNQDGLGY